MMRKEFYVQETLTWWSESQRELYLRAKYTRSQVSRQNIFKDRQLWLAAYPWLSLLWDFIIFLLSPYSTGNWVCVGYKTQMKSTQKTCNVHVQKAHRHPYSTDWRLRLASGLTQILALGNAKIYQHVGISNAKFWHWGYCPTPTPDARYFALQLNIGLRGIHLCNMSIDSHLITKFSDTNLREIEENKPFLENREFKKCIFHFYF